MPVPEIADKEGSGDEGEFGPGMVGAAEDGCEGDHDGCAESCGHGKDGEVADGCSALRAAFGYAGPKGESAGKCAEGGSAGEAVGQAASGAYEDGDSIGSDEAEAFYAAGGGGVEAIEI
jgi:hypothetical protein